jgi:hypothetical protein
MRQVAFYEPALDPVHRGQANADAGGDQAVAGSGIRSHQDLRPLDAANRLAPQQSLQLALFSVTQSHVILYRHRSLLRFEAQPISPPVMPSSAEKPGFTSKQGEYLAFIYAYTRGLGRPPAEADIQRHFGVTPPTRWCSSSNAPA